MRLKEWKDSNGNKVSTTSGTSSSTTSSGSFKKRLDKLIKYYEKHLPAGIDYIHVSLLTDDTLEFTENYDTGSVATIKIYIGPTTEAWYFTSTVDGKLTDDILGMGWTELLKTLRAYITVPVTGTPEYKGLLTEWVDKNGKKVSLNNSVASQSTAPDYKKRFEKLIDYHISHCSSELESITKKIIKDNSFLLGEHYNTGSKEFDRTIIVAVNKTTGESVLTIFVDGKEVYHNDYKSYEEVVEILTGTYMFLPDKGTQEYEDLLEWVDKSGKKVNTGISSQPTSNIKSQKEKYKKLLAQIDADNISTYTVNELTDTVLDFNVSTKYKPAGYRVKIEYVPATDDFILQVADGTVLKGNDWNEDILTLFGAGAILSETDILRESYSLADDFRLYETLWD